MDVSGSEIPTEAIATSERPSAPRRTGSPKASGAGLLAPEDRRVIEQVGDRYELVERLGGGSFGIVYLARERSPLGRLVALKVQRADANPGADRGMFLRESRALSVLRHRNIAAVYDAGVTPAGLHLISMELVNGKHVDRHADDEQLSIAARVRLMLDACAAVQYAHVKGVLHKDLKPANVLVGHDDASGGMAIAKVIDFGVCDSLHGQDEVEAALRRRRTISGSFAYMSPEQADLSGMDIDSRTDVYSLGVILYQLITGRLPIDEQRLSQRPLAELAAAIREAEPSPPSEALARCGGAGPPGSADLSVLATARSTTPGQLVRQVRGDLDAIVMKCLEPAREQRYLTCADLAEDLSRWLRHEPVRARSSTWTRRAAMFVRRNRASVAIGILTAGLILAGAIGTTGGLISTRHLLRRAEDELVRHHLFKRFVVDEIIAQASVDDPDGLGRDATIISAIQRSEPRMAEHLDGDPLVEAELRAVFGEVLFSAGDYRQALDLAQAAEKLLAPSVGQIRIPELLIDSARLRINNLMVLAGSAARLEDFQLADRSSREALQLAEDSYGRGSQRHLDVMRNRAIILARRGDYDEAIRMLEHVARERARISDDADPRGVIDALAQIVRIELQRGNADAVLAERAESLAERASAQLAERDPLRIIVDAASGRALGAAGDHAGAATRLLDAWQRARSVLKIRDADEIAAALIEATLDGDAVPGAAGLIGQFAEAIETRRRPPTDELNASIFRLLKAIEIGGDPGGAARAAQRFDRALEACGLRADDPRRVALRQ